SVFLGLIVKERGPLQIGLAALQRSHRGVGVVKRGGHFSGVIPRWQSRRIVYGKPLTSEPAPDGPARRSAAADYCAAIAARALRSRSIAACSCSGSSWRGLSARHSPSSHRVKRDSWSARSSSASAPAATSRWV